MAGGPKPDPLDFETHRQEVANYLALPNEETRLYFLHQAQYLHSLVVHDALRDAFFSSIATASSLRTDEGRYFLQFGVGRRFRMMFASYREIIGRIAPSRTDPLPQDDVGIVCRDLNVIYINMLGVLDNYAWSLLHEVATENARRLPPSTIGLFSKHFMTDAKLVALKENLEPFRQWFSELRERRDPAAHRIPLSVPPSVLTSNELARYRELEEQIRDAVHKLDFDLSDQLNKEQEGIGTFSSHFLHHPDEPLIPLYPTVPQDVANLIKIDRLARNFLGSVRAVNGDAVEGG